MRDITFDNVKKTTIQSAFASMRQGLELLLTRESPREMCVNTAQYHRPCNYGH